MPCSAEARVLVECSVCHIRYDVSARSHRDIKAGRVTARCMIHRKRTRPATVRAEHRRFWLDRFSIEEITEMASAIWARPSELRNGILTASSDGHHDPPRLG